MSKTRTKRKVITKIVHKNLTDKEKEFFYSRGIQDALHTVLVQHKELIQLKDLCTEYEKLFKQPHPTRDWHLHRKTSAVSSIAKESDTTIKRDGEEGNGTDNTTNEQTQDVKEVQPTEQETTSVTGSQETAS